MHWIASMIFAPIFIPFLAAERAVRMVKMRFNRDNRCPFCEAPQGDDTCSACSTGAAGQTT